MTQTPWQNDKVLIVDDSKVVIDHLKQAYKSVGMEVVGVATDGIEALKFLEGNEVDVVSLDIIMPNMHGIDCYKEILKKNPNQKCVFISVLVKNNDFVSAFAESIPKKLFHSKPIEKEELESLLTYAYQGEDQIDKEPFKDVIKLDATKNQVHVVAEYNESNSDLDNTKKIDAG